MQGQTVWCQWRRCVKLVEMGVMQGPAPRSTRHPGVSEGTQRATTSSDKTEMATCWCCPGASTIPGRSPGIGGTSRCVCIVGWQMCQQAWSRAMHVTIPHVWHAHISRRAPPLRMRSIAAGCAAALDSQNERILDTVRRTVTHPCPSCRAATLSPLRTDSSV